MNTGLDRPFGGAFDSDGNLYIPSGESNSVLVFATADLTGTGNLNLTPVRTIKGGNTGLALPAGVAFDGNGDLYVAQQIGPVEVFAAADLVGTGELDLNPLRTIIVPSTGGGQLVFDDNGNLYVGAGFSVVAFSAVDLTGTGPSTPTPLRTIVGDNTDLSLPTGLAFDGNGTLYVADIDSKSVKALTSGSLAGTGDLNLTPARTIVGSNTGLSEPSVSSSVLMADSTSPVPPPIASPRMRLRTWPGPVT